MEREEEGNICSCFCTLLIVAGVSLMLVSWDIDVIEQFKSADLVGAQEYYIEIWEVAMCLTVTLAWFTLPVMISCLACRCHSATTVFGVVLLILGGPNMMIWNIIGCTVGALKFSEFCFMKTDCDSDFMVLTMKVGTWILLYLISLLCLYGLFAFIKNVFSDFRLHNRMKRWRNTKKLGDVLLDTACSICLDNMRSGEDIETMPKCKHTFHKECVEIWLQDHPTCPVCRQDY